MKINNILCVCVGNICRSCAAEKIFQKKISRLSDSKEDSNFTVQSAGLAALVGKGIHSEMAHLLKGSNVNNLEHKAKNINIDLINWSDLILVMESNHKKSIVNMASNASGKCFLLSHWMNREDITDPYRRDSECFQIVYQKIIQCVDSWMLKLVKL